MRGLLLSAGTALLLAGILVGGAVGVMVGASSAPQIHACITPHTDTLVYSSSGKCAAGAKPIAWNNEGPAGPVGPTGQQGPAGQPGSSGGSGGGVSFYEGSTGPGSVSAGGTAVATVTVPAGGYIVSYALTVSATSTAPGACSLSTGLNGSFVTFASSTTVTLSCSTSGGGTFAWDGAAIIAEVATRLN